MTPPRAEPEPPAFEDEDGAGLAGDDAGVAPAPPAAAPAALDERSRRILAFERRWWRRPGAKEQAIRDTFGLTATRYYQVLNALLDDPAALAHDPLLIGRLRRLRARRAGGSGRVAGR